MFDEKATFTLKKGLNFAGKREYTFWLERKNDSTNMNEDKLSLYAAITIDDHPIDDEIFNVSSINQSFLYTWSIES